MLTDGPRSFRKNDVMEYGVGLVRSIGHRLRNLSNISRSSLLRSSPRWESLALRSLSTSELLRCASALLSEKASITLLSVSRHSLIVSRGYRHFCHLAFIFLNP